MAFGEGDAQMLKCKVGYAPISENHPLPLLHLKRSISGKI
jgi:hypothetical protein